MKPAKTARALAAKHNTDPSDIHSLQHAPDAPPIAETDLSVTVLELCKVSKFIEAAMAIELAVRRAYEVEAAS